MVILFDFEVGTVNYYHKNVIDCIDMDSGHDICFYNTESDESNKIRSLTNISQFINKYYNLMKNYLGPFILRYDFISLFLNKRH